MQNQPTPLYLQLAQQLASFARPLPIRKIMEMSFFAGMSESQIYYLLQKARDAAVVISAGANRHTRWQASAEVRLNVLRTQLNEPLEKRPRVTYDSLFLEEYAPNKTFYLTEGQRSRLHSRSPVGSAEFQKLSDHDRRLFMCGLSAASAAMEGSTIDYAGTEQLIMNGIKHDGASARDTTMVLNHHEAVRYLIDNVHYPPQNNDLDIQSRDIKSLHALLSAYLLKDENDCGAIRKTPVLIGHSSYIPLSVSGAIERSFGLAIKKANDIKCPFEKSFFLLVHLPYLQPFVDCNKRTARVACNIPLLRSGVLPMSWLDVDRKEYTDGILGVYERCNPTLLAASYTEGYLRSAERFEIMRTDADPDKIRVKYRMEIRNAVRGIVLDNETPELESVDEADRDAFSAHVQNDLVKLKEGHQGLMIMCRLSEAEIDHWAQGVTSNTRQRQ